MNCQHPGCKCANATVDRGGKKYCSNACADKGAAAGGACDCGHPGCR